MQIHVLIRGNLQKPMYGDDFSIEIEEDSTIHDLLILLKYEKKHVRYITAIENGVPKKHFDTLSNNDIIEIFTVIGGG